MEATTWPKSEYAHQDRERPVTFMQHDAAGTSPRAAVSVLILYGDYVVAAGLRAALHEHVGFQIVPTPELTGLKHGPPPADIVLADYDTALSLAQSAPRWANRLVVLTYHDSEAKICRALECGVGGYLLHGVGLAELLGGIRSVSQGGVTLSPLVAARVARRIQGKALTRREKAVLEQLMLGLTNKRIALKLNMCLGTVKSHLKAILAKLEADSRTAAVIVAQRRGLLP